MKLAALVSGGKDSMYALKKARDSNEIYTLIAIESEEGSEFFHRQNLRVVKLQAEALDLPLIYRKTSREEEVQTLRKTVEEEISDQVDGIVSGAIASEYQKRKTEGLCKKHGLECLVPLWHVDEERFMEQLIEEGFEVVITKVAAQGLGKGWLGRKLDEKALEELKEIREKYGIHLAGEGGEYETLVLDCPMFEKRIETQSAEKSWDPKTKSGALEVKVELREK